MLLVCQVLPFLMCLYFLFIRRSIFAIIYGSWWSLLKICCCLSACVHAYLWFNICPCTCDLSVFWVRIWSDAGIHCAFLGTISNFLSNGYTFGIKIDMNKFYFMTAGSCLNHSTSKVEVQFHFKLESFHCFLWIKNLMLLFICGQEQRKVPCQWKLWRKWWKIQQCRRWFIRKIASLPSIVLCLLTLPMDWSWFHILWFSNFDPWFHVGMLIWVCLKFKILFYVGLWFPYPSWWQ